MKNIKVLLFAAILGSFYACEDAIDIIQPGERNDADEVYPTIVELERGLQGIYGAVSTESTIEFVSIFTDETSIGINNGGQGLNDGSYAHQLFAGSDAPLSIWQTNYTTINLTNRLLLAAERITIDDDEDAIPTAECQIARRDYVVAQLHAIRAFCHFQLMTYFSTDLKSNSALGVIILDVVPPTDNYDLFLPRSTNGEVFTFIDTELQKSSDLLTVAADDDGAGICDDSFFYQDNFRITPLFITALKARMAAYRGDYPNALVHATAALDESGIASKTAYPILWNDTNESGIIFKLRRVPGDFTIASYWFSQNSSLTGSPFFEVSRSLYDSYLSTDIRKVEILDASSKVAASTAGLANPRLDDVLILDKYPGSKGVNLLNDIKVFRGEEMLLIKAEAYAAAGAYDGASNSVASELKRLRDDRYNTIAPLPNYGGSAQAAWADILLERRRELAFEGHRYIDIKRLSGLAGTNGIDRAPFDCALYNACTLSATDHRFTLPIPTNEIIANPSISGQQNPGY